MFAQRTGSHENHVAPSGSDSQEGRKSRSLRTLRAHSTEVAGLHDNPGGDLRFFNNLFAAEGTLAPYDDSRQPCAFGGDVFLGGATPCVREERSPPETPLQRANCMDPN